MGNGIDANKTTSFKPEVNYVSRDSNNNGVVGKIDNIENEILFPPGSMTISLGGSFLGSSFIQKESFYTAQNVAVAQEKTPLSIYSKLFISSLIRHECKVKFLAFGRELNKHIRTDFSIKLPVLQDQNGFILDKEKRYSEDGFQPDFEVMKNINISLPFADRI